MYLKKWFALVMALCLALALSACAGTQVTSDRSDSPSPSHVKLVIESPSPSASGGEDADASPSSTDPSHSGGSQEGSPDAPGDSDEYGETEHENNEDMNYSLTIGTITLKLRQTKLNATLESLPNKRISDETEVLGQGSDTFTGSFLRTLKYDGLELMLFAPKDNPDNFWLMMMTVTTSDAKTEQGIKVGDTVEALLAKYPDAEQAEGDSGETIYIVGGGTTEELMFTISSDAITKITLSYFMT
jgi:hypothetical protein